VNHPVTFPYPTASAWKSTNRHSTPRHDLKGPELIIVIVIVIVTQDGCEKIEPLTTKFSLGLDRS
jgi:hypothetical protein